jgi:hypothetical protein
MYRVYPPVWCKGVDCKECDFSECELKTLKIFSPYKYEKIDFTNRPKEVDTTSIAVYFGFCQRLAKFFLLLPQDSSHPAVRRNFIASVTGHPAKAPIQRILLDTIDRGDPEAPTNEVHKMRLLLNLKLRGKQSGALIGGKEDIEVRLSSKEAKEFCDIAMNWVRSIFEGKVIPFNKTDILERCAYCFLPN